MKAISVLQIGDVHYPCNKDVRLVDRKDTSVPAIASAISPKALPKVIRAISTLAQKRPPAAILVCGDLTTRGNTDAYERCVKYLITSLKLVASKNKNDIHVVPGNHDVDRELCTLRAELNLNKFDRLAAAWRTEYDDVLVTNGVRETHVSDSRRELTIFSLNSCIGCGEWRLLPDHVRDELGAAIEDLRKRDPTAAFRVEGEQLDTPMFDHDDIETLNQKIRDLDINVIPVVLAHHNLLPQELQRIELYTELINSGQFRTTLTAADRPVVYCHGHIHKSPIESICDSTKRESQLISVSAPQLTDGFNELRFHFSRQQQPLGVDVVLHRIMDNGNVVELDCHRIPFANRQSFLTQELEDLKSCLTSDRIRFAILKQSFEKQCGVETNQLSFEELIVEAEWLGMVEIENNDKPALYWLIRRKWV
ncbi:MAG: metallophosphoesterase [Candidatus Nealsonbacteria bacterium]|nr:metallophosphoesterase [Candidatus Nealsonbacteria bacterium]